MDLKCKHPDWEACSKCIDSQEEKIQNQNNGNYDIHNYQNELICKKNWCREKLPIESMYDNHLNLCKKPKSKKSTVCPQCNKQFSKVSNLNRHVATVHSILRKYVCRNCSRSYYDAEKLDKHLQRCNYNIHALKTPGGTVRDFNAVDDEMKDRSSDVDDHDGLPDDNDEDLDSGEDLPSMVMMENGHHESADDDEDSNDNESVNQEVKPLQICNSLFMKKNANKTRLQINNDIKMLKKRKRKSTVCPHCLKQFSRVSNLNRHVRTVHGIKKFCCKECSKSYATIAKLNEHFRIMHPSISNGETSSMQTENGLTNGDDSYEKKLSPKEIFEAEENTVVILDNYDLDNVDLSSFSKKVENDSNHTQSSVTTSNGVKLPVDCKVETKNGDNVGKDQNGSMKASEVSYVKGSSLDDIADEKLAHLNGNGESMIKNETPILDDSPTLKKRVICPHCDKEFSKVSNMNRHIFDVHNIRYVCENCSKSFAQPEKLDKHLLTSCNPDKNYKLLKADTALPCMVIEEIFH